MPLSLYKPIAFFLCMVIAIAASGQKTEAADADLVKKAKKVDRRVARSSVIWSAVTVLGGIRDASLSRRTGTWAELDLAVWRLVWMPSSALTGALLLRRLYQENVFYHQHPALQKKD